MALLKAGDIGIIRTTGEKVYIVDVEEVEDYATYHVIRPTSDKGEFRHEFEEYPNGFVSTVEAFAHEQVAEMLLKMRVQKDLQKADLRIQSEIDNEMELEAATPAADKAPEVN